LFACYDGTDLPRTNKDLEQAFGSHRYHERRACGRTVASPSLVLRDAAKLIAGLATWQRDINAAELAGADRPAWTKLRAELNERRERRIDRRRFRNDPNAILNYLENKLNRSRLRA
jgi:hypothetical protein